MPGLSNEGVLQRYRDAFRRRVCVTCLDGAGDGSCGLTGRTCALETHLTRIIEAIAPIESPRMADYVAAIEDQVCRRCSEQDPNGHCAVRSNGNCALYSYLSLVVDAIEEARGGLGKVNP